MQSKAVLRPCPARGARNSPPQEEHPAQVIKPINQKENDVDKQMQFSSEERGVTRVTAGIIDHFSPEVQAMLIARYSRDPAYIRDRLPNTEEELQKAMDGLKRVYLSWNHKSVGQLGYTTVFFERVSILAAYFLEDTPYFNGQECSTRYLDFSNATCEDAGNEKVREMQGLLMKAYGIALPILVR